MTDTPDEPTPETYEEAMSRMAREDFIQRMTEPLVFRLVDDEAPPEADADAEADK